MTTIAEPANLKNLVADRPRLADALKAADIVPLLLVYTQLQFVYPNPNFHLKLKYL